MTTLIPYAQRSLNGETVQTVDARDLHGFLEVGKDYTNWIKSQIRRAQLIENKDFALFAQKGVNPTGGRPTREYFLTFDAAKHISMMSGSKKGREAREYFIACEKALLAQATPTFERYPELRAIVELVEATAEARTLAESAQREAVEAKALATQAIDAQQFLTIAEYVFVNGLSAQLPQAQYRECGAFLSAYCLQHNIPVRKIFVAGKHWEHEYGYHVGTIAQVLPGWLARRFAQGTMQLIQ